MKWLLSKPVLACCVIFDDSRFAPRVSGTIRPYIGSPTSQPHKRETHSWRTIVSHMAVDARTHVIVLIIRLIREDIYICMKDTICYVEKNQCPRTLQIHLNLLIIVESRKKA